MTPSLAESGVTEGAISQRNRGAMVEEVLKPCAVRAIPKRLAATVGLMIEAGTNMYRLRKRERWPAIVVLVLT